MSADWALIVLLKPLFDAFLVVQVTAWHLSGFVLEILVTNSTSWVLKLTSIFILFTIFLSDLYFWQISDGFLACWRIASATSVLHRSSENLFKNIVTKE
jgi:hypothetical protein